MIDRYALTMFPCTSRDLHIGHWYAMVPSHVAARLRYMQGYNVLHPVGFDAFGPIRQAADIALASANPGEGLLGGY